jgi:hypothetical protein
MKIDYELPLSKENECFHQLLRKLKEDLSGLPPISAHFGKSKTIRDKMKVLARDWHTKVSVNPKIRDKDGRQNYFVEYMKDFQCDTCGMKHRLLLEVGLDNREAIPANLLKLDIAASSFIKAGGKALGVVVCVNAEARRIGKWDGSVGTSEEYVLGIDTGYSDYISSEIIPLAIKA